MFREIIFHGRDLKATLYSQGSQRLLVTFVGRNKKPSFDNAFAVEFGLKRNCNVLAVCCSNNHWYQTKEVAEIAKLIDLLNCRDVFLYGASMGGYGAVLLSTLISRPATVISLSPQYGISQQDISFDKRWLQNFDQAKAIFKNCQLSTLHKYFFVYDNLHPIDRLHVKKFNQSSFTADSIEIKVAFAGHVVGEFSPQFLGLTVESILNKSLVTSVIASERRKMRHGSAVYFKNLIKGLFENEKNSSCMAAVFKFRKEVNDDEFSDTILSRLYLRESKPMLALKYARKNLDTANASEGKLRHLISVYWSLKWTYEAKLFAHHLAVKTGASSKTLAFLEKTFGCNREFFKGTV